MIGFESFIDLITKLEPLFTLMSTLLWGLYVWFTIKTFREIQRQTELQSQAFVVIAANIQNHSDKVRQKFEPTIVKLHEKWKDILDLYLPDAVQAERLIVIKLKNRGQCDVVYWKLSVNIEVHASTFLNMKYNTSNESLSWTTESTSEQDHIPPGEQISFAIGPSGYFPLAEISWKLTYRDMRGNVYTNATGTDRVGDTNALALRAGKSLPATENLIEASSMDSTSST